MDGQLYMWVYRAPVRANNSPPLQQGNWRPPKTRHRQDEDGDDDLRPDPALGLGSAVIFWGYLSNFATRFQKFHFFLKIDQNQWF